MNPNMRNMGNNKIIIGFSGMSCSGYSDTAQKLIENFPWSVLFSSNNYFSQNQIPRINLNGNIIINWEEPCGVQWDQLITDIQNCPAELIFVSSFLLFYSETLKSLLNAAIVFEYSQNDMIIGAERRMNKGKHSKQNVDFSNPYAQYFRDVVWPSGWKNKIFWDGSNSNIPILKLRAVDSQERVLPLSFRHIWSFCPKSIQSIYPIRHFSPKIIIGFSGMSTSGKSLTASTLLSRFKGADIISTDKFFDRNLMPVITVGGESYHNWEEPTGVRWESVIKSIADCKADLIFIDSFLLFYSPQIQSMLTGAIVFEYLENEMMTGVERRVRRKTNFNGKVDFSNSLARYYRDVVWPRGCPCTLR